MRGSDPHGSRTSPGACLLVGLLAGCGDGGGAAPDAGDSCTNLAWSECSGHQCATLTVPADHDDPSGETVDLRVMRIRAFDPETRLGTLIAVTNWAGSAVDDWGSVLFTSAVADSMLRFDRVMFDRRGTGESVPLDCGLDDLVEQLRAIPARPTPADWAAIDAVTQTIADRCVGDYGVESLRRIGAPTIARDMDLIREALCEEQVSYLGYSYSTWLGAVYTSTFPERLRAGVLDSVGQPDAADALEYEANLDISRENYLTQFFDWCGADATGTCTFHGGEGSPAVAAAYDALFAASSSDPLLVDGRPLRSRDFASAVIGHLDPSPGEFPALANLLAAAETGDGAPLLAEADAYFGRAADGTYDSGRAIGRIITIRLADRPCPAALTDLATAPAAWDLQYTAAPHTGGINTLVPLMCLHWPASPATATVISAPTAPPLLLVGGANDPGSPYADAAAMATALDNGSHVLRYDGWGHGYTILSECVANAESDYLADPAGFTLPGPACD